MIGWIAFTYSWIMFIVYLWSSRELPRLDWELLAFLFWPIAFPVLIVAGAFTEHGWRAQRRRRVRRGATK